MRYHSAFGGCRGDHRWWRPVNSATIVIYKKRYLLRSLKYFFMRKSQRYRKTDGMDDTFGFANSTRSTGVVFNNNNNNNNII